MFQRVHPHKLTGADQPIRTGAVRYFGNTTLRNSHATDVISARVYDGVDATGPMLASFSLAAAEEALPQWFGPQGVTCELGVYVDVTGTGTLEGSLFLGDG